MTQLGFVVDLDRCIGCGGCQVACKLENQIALGPGRISVKTVGPNGTYPDLEMYYLPAMCQQCKDPSCVKVCPTGACYKSREDGTIKIDQDLCIACLSCQGACPYQANYLNQEKRVMDKCTICEEARIDGLKPACVRNCPASALIVGDFHDPNSPVSVALSQVDPRYVYTLKDQGDGPSTRYILRRGQWQDLLPHQCKELMVRRKGV